MKRWARLALAGTGVALAAVLVPAGAASAHPAQTSGVYLGVGEASVELELLIPIDRLALGSGLDLAYTDDLDQALASVEANAAAVEAYLVENVALSDDDGRLALAVGGLEVGIVNEAPALIATLTATPADGSVDGDLALDYGVVISTVAAHDVYVATVADPEAFADGALTEEEQSSAEIVAVLDSGHTSATIDRGGSSPGRIVLDTLALGMRHIAEGTDHLLFLMTLLLVTPLVAAGGRWRRVRGAKQTTRRTAAVVTAFTGGHTVALALVSFGLVSFPTKPVELLVAASIVVAAAHAIRPLARRGEVWIAGAFGLVHGTAFATTILELGLNKGSTVWAVLGFDLGIEAAQLIAVVLVLPLILALVRTRAYPWLRVGLALFAVVAATAWIVGILRGDDSVLAPFFATLGEHAVPAYAAAVGVVALLWAFTRRAPRPAVTRQMS